MSELHDVATVDEIDKVPSQMNNIYIYKGGKVDEQERQKVEHVRVDESVTVIEDEAFAHCYHLKTVEFSKNHNNTIKAIGDKSFYQCLYLSSINLHDTQVETIGDRTFHSCENLTTFQFPSSIRQIGKSCFSGCKKIKNIDLSYAKALTTIAEGTFCYCYALTTVNLPPSLASMERQSFQSCEALDMIDLRATCLNEIMNDAFCRCKNLSTIYLPKMIKAIGESSFHKCEALSSVDLQTTLTERIGDNVFSNCHNLTTISFPKTLKYIGNYSFRCCTKLESLNLLETSIEKIGNHTFYNCTNLTTVVGISSHRHEGDERQESIDGDIVHHDGCMKFPPSLVDIGWNTFDKCPKLQNAIDNNWIHYECDINRGGRRFLQREHHHYHKDVDNNDGNNKSHGKAYYSSLWPLIIHRVLYKMKLPHHKMCRNDDNLSLYTTAVDPLQRRLSVVFYVLVNGVIADLQS